MSAPLVDVRPVLVPQDAADRTVCNAVLAPNLREAGGSSARADLADQIRGEPRLGVCRPNGSTGSTLLLHVAVVVRDGADEQMVRIHASRNIAPMEDAQAGGDPSVGSEPRDAMGERGVRYAAPAHVNDPVPPPDLSAGPHPATRTLLHLRPEASEERRILNSQSDTIIARHVTLHRSRAVEPEVGVGACLGLAHPTIEARKALRGGA